MQRLDKTAWDHAPPLPGYDGWRIMSNWRILSDWSLDEGSDPRWVEVLFAGDSYVVVAAYDLGGVLAVRVCGWWATEEQANAAKEVVAKAFFLIAEEDGGMRAPRCHLWHF